MLGIGLHVVFSFLVIFQCCILHFRPGENRTKIGKFLKGPKCEIFGFGFFALIRPIWIGDLGTRPKNY
jgi:hypothetical protein